MLNIDVIQDLMIVIQVCRMWLEHFYVLVIRKPRMGGVTWSKLLKEYMSGKSDNIIRIIRI